MEIMILVLTVLILAETSVLCVASPKILSFLKAVPTKDDLTEATKSPEAVAAEEAATQAAQKLAQLKSAAKTLGVTVTADMDTAAIQAAITAALAAVSEEATA